MTRVGTFALVLVGFVALGLVVTPVLAHCGSCAGSAAEMQKAMDTGKVTLASAFTAAEGHSKGKAVAGRATLEGGKLGFHVHCLVGEKMVDVTVDGAGKATKMEDSKMKPEDVSKQKEVLKAMEAGKVTLGGAAGAAETHAKGKGMAAMGKTEGGKLMLDVFCLVGDKIQEVDVDGAGKATGMKEAKALPECKH